MGRVNEPLGRGDCPRPAAAPALLVDIGCNLAHRAFGSDRDAVVAEAATAGVTALVITGTDLRASREAAWLARGAPGRLFATAGVHPHQARTWDSAARETLRQLALRPEVVALGECGLDFDRSFSPPPDQERCFEAQLVLAAELRKPVFLHERAAFERFAAILERHRPGLVGGVVHCFTSDGRALDRYLAMGLHIGVTGWICDRRRGGSLRELVRRVPADRLMLETDAPFLLPDGVVPRPPGRRNVPAFLPYVLAEVARARGEPPAQVAASTTATARAFFGLGLAR